MNQNKKCFKFVNHKIGVPAIGLVLSFSLLVYSVFIRIKYEDTIFKDDGVLTAALSFLTVLFAVISVISFSKLFEKRIILFDCDEKLVNVSCRTSLFKKNITTSIPFINISGLTIERIAVNKGPDMFEVLLLHASGREVVKTLYSEAKANELILQILQILQISQVLQFDKDKSSDMKCGLIKEYNEKVDVDASSLNKADCLIVKGKNLSLTVILVIVFGLLSVASLQHGIYILFYVNVLIGLSFFFLLFGQKDVVFDRSSQTMLVRYKNIISCILRKTRTHSISWREIEELEIEKRHDQALDYRVVIILKDGRKYEIAQSNRRNTAKKWKDKISEFTGVL